MIRARQVFTPLSVSGLLGSTGAAVVLGSVVTGSLLWPTTAALWLVAGAAAALSLSGSA